MGERALLGGRYELGPAIGSGGFATVFRARDRHADVDVAIKLVPPGFDSARLIERLRSEAAVLKRLSSRHLARVFELGSDERGVWLVTELIEGVPLSIEGLGRALLPHEVLRVARGLLEGLSVAHGAGVVHADVKPSNILVPRTAKALDGPKLIDFGLARIDAAPASSRGREGPGIVMGSARWMAPELLYGGEVDMRSDVYAAGLVLFDLLGEGDLFPTDGSRPQQMRARIASDPVLEGRVPAPLSTVLARMLARDPLQRYRDAGEALGAIIDLDTAPVSTLESIAPASVRRPSFAFSALRVSTGPTGAEAHPPRSLRSLAQANRQSSGPPSRTVPLRPLFTRLSALPDSGIDGLRETLRHLDLPMLDALARRERGNVAGRTARALALGLRLELDAAALILEPLAHSSDVARAVGATVLGPRARRVTRGRIDSDREDKWVDTVPAELGALLVMFAAVLSLPEDAARDASRCSRALSRLEGVDVSADVETARWIASSRITLRFAIAAARVRSGELTPAAAHDLVTPLERGGPGSPFECVVRPILAATILARLDEGRARDELERAVRAASDAGLPFLEVCASAAWGRLLVVGPQRTEQGLAVLGRVATLLAHGDAPTLEHEAEHHRAAGLIMQGRWKEAVPRLRAAREAAHAERALEAEVFSASLEVVAHLALGEHDPAREAAAVLGDARIGTARGCAGAFAWIAKCIEALASGEHDVAEDALAEAHARSRETESEGLADAYVIVDVLSLLFDAAKGRLPDVGSAVTDLERFAADHGFTSFYWFDALRRVVDGLDDPPMAARMHDVLARVTLLLGPASRMARASRTSLPPASHP